MFQFRNRNFSEERSNFGFNLEYCNLNDEDRRKPWYKRIFFKLMNWATIIRGRKRNKYCDPIEIEIGPKFQEDLNIGKKDQLSMSLDDIPRNSLKMNKSDTGINELSPLTNDSWKEDSKLMLNGKYYRFQVVELFLKKYKIISIIGQGSFGFVLKAERLRDGKEVAIKFIYRFSINSSNWLFDPELGMIPSEIYYLKSLRHSGIIQFLDYFDDGRYVYMITELFGTSWCPAMNKNLNSIKNPGIKMDNRGSSSVTGSPCDLFECIEAHKHLPERTIHYIFMQLLDIVFYLSSEGIVHRDLKDENVVIDSNYRIKIIDFGCAARVPFINSSEMRREEGWFDKFNGTLAFAPPEVIRGQKYRGSEAEIWTLGVLLYTMSFRQAPFPDSQSILYNQLEFPFEEESPGT